jgi:hypothetical protein
VAQLHTIHHQLHKRTGELQDRLPLTIALEQLFLLLDSLSMALFTKIIQKGRLG